MVALRNKYESVAVAPAPVVFTLQEAPPAPRQIRRDALPEHTSYADTGCDLHHSCLSCPLARCRYDEDADARRLMSADRDRGVLELHRQGHMTIEAIAREFGISRRTVFRILARDRHGKGN